MTRTRLKCLRIGGLLMAVSAFTATTVLGQRLQSDGIKDLSEQIVSSITKQQKRRVAVVPFRELNGQATVFGTYLAEELTTYLFNAGSLDIVERTMLDKIMTELKLDSSGAIDPSSAKRIGQLAGVDAIVTGSITEFPSYVAVNSRVIDVQTGRVFAAAQTRIVKDDDVRAVLGRPLGVGQAVGGLPTRAESGSVPAGPSASAAGLQFTVVECARSANSIECRFMVLTKQDQDVRIGCEPSTNTRAFDNQGRPLQCGRALLANQETSGSVGREVTLVGGIPVSLSLTFEGATQDSVAISRLDIAFAFRSLSFGLGGWNAVQFRNISIVNR